MWNGKPTSSMAAFQETTFAELFEEITVVNKSFYRGKGWDW